jgi:hypothetical protein
MTIEEQNEKALTQAKIDLVKMQIERDVLKAQVERMQLIIDELMTEKNAHKVREKTNEILTNKK